MVLNLLRIALCVIAFLLCHRLAVAAEIKVIGGSAVIPAMDILVARFERATANTVVADFDGAIGAMAKRVAMGERADVVVVSHQQIDSLEKEGKVLGGTARDIGKVGVGVFIRRGVSKPNIASVESFT